MRPPDWRTRVIQMLDLRRLPFVLAGLFVLAGCAVQPKPVVTRATSHRLKNVRTTAYTRGEAGGRKNAMGVALAGKNVRSAASDWSRFPLGTRFKIIATNEEYIIDDYGTALIGTNTIDLYKPSRLEMKRWGVRHVDIDILEWGSREKSLKVLTPRAHHSHVRRMIVSLQKHPSDQALRVD